MADRDGIQVAIKVMNDVNSMCTMMLTAADRVIEVASNIDGLVAVQAKKDKLIEGLTALGVDLTALNTDKTTAVNAANAVKSAVQELTKY